MPKKRENYKGAVSQLPKDSPASPEYEDKDESDEKRTTLYLPRAVYEQIRALAFEMRISQQELYRRGMNMIFADKGLPLWEELAPPKKGNSQ